MVVGRWDDFADRPYNGFVRRHARSIRWASDVATVELLALGTAGADDVHPDLRDFPRQVVDLPVRPTGRATKFLPWRPATAWSAAVVQKVGPVDQTVAVTLGPWLDEEYAPVFELLPTVHVFEEDVSRMRELGSQSLQARVARRISRFARQKLIAKPTSVVTVELRLNRAMPDAPTVAKRNTFASRRRLSPAGPHSPVAAPAMRFSVPACYPRFATPSRWPN